MPTHAQSVHEQFDPQAQAYLASPVHADGPDIACAERLVRQALGSSGAALDVGCGAGHLSFRLAPQVSRIIALDPSPGMLATVAQAAAARGLDNLETCQASVESLPFEPQTFELVTTRYSAHHWIRVEAGLREIRRISKSGGWLLLIDSLAPDDALVDTHLQAIELLRDRSHVRNRTTEQWQALLARAGFALIEQHQWPTRIAFAPWVERMRTPAEHVSTIRSLQAMAPQEVQQALGYEPDGSFLLQTGLFWTRRVS